MGIIVSTSDGCVGFIAAAQAKGVSVAPDSEVEAVVLDIDASRSVLDLAIRPKLVAGIKAAASKVAEEKPKKGKKGKKAKKANQQLFDVDQDLDTRVELIKVRFSPH